MHIIKKIRIIQINYKKNIHSPIFLIDYKEKNYFG